MSSLTVYVPGLLEADSPGLHAALKVPHLELLLSRARRESGTDSSDVDRRLCELFGFTPPGDGDVPVAALTRLLDFDGDEHRHAWLMRADPVYLQPDLHRLILFDLLPGALPMAQARSLAQEINQHLARDGLAIEIGREPTRWYLRLPEAVRLRTTPLPEVIGRHIDPALPVGADARAWHRLGNEIQMILHASQVNRERQANQQVPVNSIWFWGLGVLPGRGATPWREVVSDNPLAAALAQHFGSRFRDAGQGEGSLLPAEWPALLHFAAGYHALRRRDYRCFREWFESLDTRSFAPIVDALQCGKLENMTILAGGARYAIDRKRLGRFWIRRRHIAAFLEASRD